jgi:hypothetical protein
MSRLTTFALIIPVLVGVCSAQTSLFSGQKEITTAGWEVCIQATKQISSGSTVVDVRFADPATGPQITQPVR